MYYNRQIVISTAGSRRATKWNPQTLWWSEFVERIAQPVRSTEPLAEYLRYPKSKQDDLKDVGGYVGGTLAGGMRKANTVTGRDIVTLDLDSIPSGGTQETLRRVDALQCTYAIYSTRKHEEYKPRLRVILPLSRTVTADEYEPVARKLASMIGMDLCDPSTFEASRLMYWPSACSDSQYVYIYADRPMIDPDGVLALYTDWHDYTQWPQVPGVQEVAKRISDKQSDPTSKRGIVGAFCRVYDIYRVMDELLPGRYEPCDIGPDRYTYTGGSTTGGAVVYEHGQFLFSHHATDPAAGKLCNAFDLVRCHLYGALDDDAKADTPINKLPSFTAMCKYAVDNSYVAALMTKEHFEEATEEFTAASQNAPATVAPEDLNWISTLKRNPTSGQLDRTVDNMLIVLECDPHLRGKLAFDLFAHRCLALGALPWCSSEGRRVWTDTDDAGIRYYLEKAYGLTGKEKIDDAIMLAMHRHEINEPRDYLLSLTWDGVPRLDTLLIDYFGTEDSLYSRAVIRKALAAAVARVMVPGTKFDYMTILAGPQGVGKSTFLRLLGKQWFTDSVVTFEGKEAYELIQGRWIAEVGELNAMNRSELNSVKQFLSKQEDFFRVAYGRRAEPYLRSTVFFGTTNAVEFLRDDTGERRFWPIDVHVFPVRKDVFKQLSEELDQVWAEAVDAWRRGEPLYLSGEVEAQAKAQQKQHKETNAKEGLIRDFLEKRIPEDWSKWDINRRQMWWGGGLTNNKVTTVERDRVCAVEIFCELFGGDPKFMKRSDTVEINAILNGMEGWVRQDDVFRFGPYGVQRGYRNTRIPDWDPVTFLPVTF